MYNDITSTCESQAQDTLAHVQIGLYGKRLLVPDAAVSANAEVGVGEAGQFALLSS